MDDSSPIRRTAQVIDITASALFASLGFAFTLGIIPVILKSPTPLLLQQWRYIYTTDHNVGPPLAVILFLNLTFVPYTKYNKEIANESVDWGFAE
jgi:hypothetical protein